jgi:NAD(P)-dependent dehydrogenase (short-subunit alcohol dehydrogenase family)
MKGIHLENKSLVIIGGTTGIGLSAAAAFIESGARVVIVGKDDASSYAAQTRLGKKAIAIQGDAVEEGTATNAIGRCHNEFGGFDGLYHVAGGSGRQVGDGPLHELSLDGWNKTLALNLTSLMLSNRAAINYLLNRKKPGTILNMGSVLATSPSSQYFTTHAYAAAKSAVIGFSKSIASYYAKHNIRINVIAPGLIETPMAQRAAGDKAIMSFTTTKQPLDGGRIGRPDDLDGLAVYFMSEASKFTTGQVVAVDGAWSVSDGQINE